VSAQLDARDRTQLVMTAYEISRVEERQRGGTVSTQTYQSLRRAGLAFIVGALITAIGGAVVQAFVQPSTAVSDDMWSYPWSRAR
jgi:hypothetical protein